MLINVLFAVFQNEYLVGPIRNRQGTLFKIPVLEREVVTVQCKFSANAFPKHKIDWQYEDFNASNTRTTIVGAIDGVEYAVSNLTVFIDKPAAIDEKEALCTQEKGGSISLQFIAYINDSNVACGPCDGKEQIKLRRWGNQTNEDLQKALSDTLMKKLIQKQGYAEDEVYLVTHGIPSIKGICGCKKILDPRSQIPDPDP